MTQCERILNYIEDFGSITTMQAFADLGCARLSGRIHDLRRMGYPIDSEFVTAKNRYGEPVTFKKYYIRKGA